MRLTFDIETDGLLDELTTIHSLVLEDPETGRMWSCTDHDFKHPSGIAVLSIDEGLRMLMEADEVIGHNIIAFDIPAIQKVKPWFYIRRDRMNDTLISSRLLWPDIRERDFTLRAQMKRKLKRRWRREQPTQVVYGGDDEEPEREALIPEADWVQSQIKLQFPGQLIGSHGLKAWGLRLGQWKGDYSDDMKAKGLDPWAEWNEDMQLYCDQDVVVTNALLDRIEQKGPTSQAWKIERDFAFIIAEMERNGFPFHQERASRLQHKLMRRQSEIYEKLQAAFPPITERWTFTPKANNSKLGYQKGVPTEKTREIVFNPGSRDHIARWLRDKYGWKPEKFTENGKPALDEKVLKKLPYEEAGLLAEYFLIDKRLGMLEGQTGKGLISFGKTGRIYGSVNPTGATTRRCTHRNPNMAQLPATSVAYGHDFRELMYAPDGWTLLGWDASGLELRCFAHYMAAFDGGEYVDTVLSGDIHWTHAIALGLVGADEERDDENNPQHDFARNKVAKRFIYAFLYGAGAEKIGEIVKPQGTAKQKQKAGKELIDTFLSRVPALAKLKEKIRKTMKRNDGKIPAIDGAWMPVRSEHSALNTLLQSAGAIAVKVATIRFYDILIEKGLKPGEDFQIVAHVHDEVQTLVREGLEEIVGTSAEQAMREAGEILGFRCPLAGDYKTGQSWAETH